MPTQLTVEPFFCPSTKSSSFKILISYPSIQNLSYNFQLKLSVYLQTLLPRISYNLVHEQTFLIPKKEIIVQHLQPSKMYKVIISWSKKGIKDRAEEEKTVFVCSEKVPEDQEEEMNQLEEEVQNEDYDRFVKGNIQNYFDQYYHNNNQSSLSRKSNLSSHKNTSSLSSYNQRPLSSNKKSTKPNQKTSFSNSQSLIKVIGQSDPFINKKHLQKYILQGRKSTSVKDYLTTKDFQCFNSCSKVYKNEEERRKHVEKTLLVSKAMNVFSEIYAFDRENGVGVRSGRFASGNSNNRKENVKGMEFFKNDWFMGPFYSYDANERQMKKKQATHNQGRDE